MSKPLLLNGRLGWVTVACKHCGADYDTREVRKSDTPTMVRFTCPKGHQSEAPRVWKSYDDNFLRARGIPQLADGPDQWRDVLKSGGWGLYETNHDTETYLLPESDYFVDLFLLPTHLAHWLFSDSQLEVIEGVPRTIAMGNTGIALREVLTEELRFFLERQESAETVLFPSKQVEHDKKPNEQDRNILRHFGMTWKDGE
jgi:hypothetical protein